LSIVKHSLVLFNEIKEGMNYDITHISNSTNKISEYL